MKAWYGSSLYGTKDAAQNWAATYTKFLVNVGLQRGRACSCNFVHKKRNIKMTVHGDDFMVVVDSEQIKWVEEQLESEYAIKAEVLGPGRELSKEILNATSWSTRRTTSTQR